MQKRREEIREVENIFVSRNLVKEREIKKWLLRLAPPE